jgi:hypothetical protein
MRKKSCPNYREFRNSEVSLYTKSTVSYDVTLCDPTEVYRRFGEMYCLYFQDRRANQASGKSIIWKITWGLLLLNLYMRES